MGIGVGVGVGSNADEGGGKRKNHTGIQGRKEGGDKGPEEGERMTATQWRPREKERASLFRKVGGNNPSC